MISRRAEFFTEYLPNLCVDVTGGCDNNADEMDAGGCDIHGGSLYGVCTLERI